MRNKIGIAFRISAATLLLTTCLVGCNDSVETTETTIENVTTSTICELDKNIDTSEALVETEPQQFFEVVNEDFKIDAEVKEYPIDGLAGVYTGEPKRISKEEIKNFLAYCGTEILSDQEQSSGSKIYYNGTCVNGAVFYAEENSNNHPYSQFQYRNEEKYRIYQDYPIYTGEESFLTNSKYTVGWMFTEPKELTFGSASEVEQSVRSALETLGLTNLTLLRTLYCDYKTLNSAMQRITTNEDYAPLGAPVENNGYPVKDDWSEEDDAYIFSFGIDVHGVPMSYRYFDSSRTAWYTGSEVVVWYTKDGIVNLIVNTPWQVKAVKTSPMPIVAAETALDVAKNKLEYDILKEDKLIEEVRLEYHYVQDRSQWLLLPVWAVACSNRSGPDTDRVYSFVHVDAITGKEL